MKVACPICKKETLYEGNPYRPFCSDRCRLVDLGMWAKEEYRIPGEKQDLPEDEPGEKIKHMETG